MRERSGSSHALLTHESDAYTDKAGGTDLDPHPYDARHDALSEVLHEETLSGSCSCGCDVWPDGLIRVRRLRIPDQDDRVLRLSRRSQRTCDRNRRRRIRHDGLVLVLGPDR